MPKQADVAEHGINGTTVAQSVLGQDLGAWRQGCSETHSDSVVWRGPETLDTSRWNLRGTREGDGAFDPDFYRGKKQRRHDQHVKNSDLRCIRDVRTLSRGASSVLPGI